MSTQAATLSRLARKGSHTSISSNGSIDLSSHNHIYGNNRLLGHIRSIPALPTWLHDWVNEPHRHEQIAVGATSRGLAVMTNDAAGVRNVLDCVPVVDEKNSTFVGWRRKAWTFPSTKTEL